MDFNKPYVCVVGGANLDIQGFPADSLVLRDSNVGKVAISMGGVGRNIAENLARLGVPVCLVSATGEDADGRLLRDEAARVGLDMGHVLTLPGETTSHYLSVLDDKGDMLVAINQMDICDHLTCAHIESKLDILTGSALCVLDTNFPEAVIGRVVDVLHAAGVPLFLDPVSSAKAERIRGRLGKFHTIKPNRIEAEILTGIPIPETPGEARQNALRRAMKHFHDLGVKQVFLSLGAAGTFCSTGNRQWLLPAPACKVVAATGAGDAFLATLAMGFFRGLDVEETARLASAAAAMALSHENTINPDLSMDALLRWKPDGSAGSG